MLRYVEHRAATKIGKVTEKPGLAAYNAAAGRSASKNNQTIEILKGEPPNYIVDRVRIPDFFIPGDVVGDVKNVNEQSNDEQMRDDARIARADRVRVHDAANLITKQSKFDLAVRAPTHDSPEGTHVTEPLSSAIKGTGGGVYKVI